VLSGDDGLTLAVMSAGGDGVISVISNAVPKLCAQLTDALAKSDLATASLIHHRLAPLVDAAFVESNPIPIKAALAMMKKCANVLRLPLVPLDARHEAHLSAALRIAGVSL
jgi:4-hydroxy-tetrahydrodipicolinate synthase